MAKDRDADELDDNAPEGDDARALGDEIDEDDEEDSDDFEDEDELDEDENATGEVGSEGGSPGDRVRTRRPNERLRGSEATETARKAR